ncbi:MAG: hypothetical protein U9Q83_06520 [Bacteroidota bacterium]|nr:hypothetical protein [Bacteroidota bacterium]
MKKIISLVLVLSIFAVVYSQKPDKNQNNIVTLLLKDPAVANLKKNYDVMNEANNPVNSFLERVVQDPSIITISEFKKEKERYYSLIDNYNSLIDEMCTHIESFDDYQKLKKIPLDQFHSPAKKNGDDIKAFVNDLGEYTNESLAFSTLITIFIQVGREIYKYYKEVQTERIKTIITVELTNLKLYKIPWEATEKIVESKKPVTEKAEIKLLINHDRAECFQILGLDNNATFSQIDSAYIYLQKKYTLEITKSKNKDFETFYTEQLSKIEYAKKYLTPEKKSKPDEKQNKKIKNDENTNQTDCKTEDLKREIQTILETFKTIKATTKQDLLKRIEELIKKY